MKRKRLYILALLLCTIATLVQASTEEEALLKQVESTKGDDRFAAIFQLILLYDGEQKMLHYIDMMEQYASQGDDTRFVGAALMLRATYYYNWGNEEEFLYHAQLSKDYSLAHDRIDRYFAIESYVVENYILKGKYETALRTIDEMLELAKRTNEIYGELNAYLCMGDVYLSGGYNEKAHEAYARSYALLDKWNEDQGMHRMEIGVKLINAAYQAKEYTRAREYCHSLITFVKSYKEESEELTALMEYADYERSFYAYSALLYLEEGDTLRAWQSLREAEKLKSNLEKMDQILNTAYAMYYNATGEHEKALDYIDRVISVFTDMNGAGLLIDAMQVKAQILADSGTYAEAYTITLEAGLMTDSLMRGRLATQISELRTLYQLDRHILEKERNRNYALLASTGLLLALLALGIWIVYSRRLQIKNRNLVRRLEEQDAMKAELKKREQEHPSSLSADARAEKTLSAEQLLFRRLEDYLLSTEAYLTTELSRKKMVSALATNETYLFDAVRTVKGMSLQEYIYSLRLEWARACLKNNPDKTIELIATESGFNTSRTFYRHFRDTYGITPSEYRRLATL